MNSRRYKKFGGGIKREVSGEVNDNCWNFLQKIHIESLNNCRNFKRFETAILLEFRNCSGINHRVNSLEWSQSLYIQQIYKEEGDTHTFIYIRDSLRARKKIAETSILRAVQRKGDIQEKKRENIKQRT